VNVEEPLKSGDLIEIGEFVLRCIFTPSEERLLSELAAAPETIERPELPALDSMTPTVRRKRAAMDETLPPQPPAKPAAPAPPAAKADAAPAPAPPKPAPTTPLMPAARAGEEATYKLDPAEQARLKERVAALAKKIDEPGPEADRTIRAFSEGIGKLDALKLIR